MRCTHFWKFSGIDFIAFHFYVCFNNMPDTLFNTSDFMEKKTYIYSMRLNNNKKKSSIAERDRERESEKVFS